MPMLRGGAREERKNMNWHKWNDPPYAEPGQWSREVIVITNYGNIFFSCYSYSGTNTEGVWQRLPELEPNDYEKVAWWVDKPSAISLPVNDDGSIPEDER